MHLATRSSKRVPGKGDKDELIEAVFPLPTTPPPWLSTSDEGERTIIRKRVKVLWFSNMPSYHKTCQPHISTSATNNMQSCCFPGLLHGEESQFQTASERMAPILEPVAPLREREGQRYLESK